ncbi:MAG: GYDIA family GHMP kinase [Bacteroidota bacterium]
MGLPYFQVRGNGKLLITGEYFVLDGALAFALPCAFGQQLKATPIEEPVIRWKSTLHNGESWIDTSFSLPFGDDSEGQTPEQSRLLQLFRAIERLNPSFFTDGGYEVETHLEFPKNWGLGSSSTLLYCLARWAKVDPYELLELTFKGSGYDIACAHARDPIVYHREGRGGVSHPVDFAPNFAEQLFFVHLNQKQNSREGIRMYRETIKSAGHLIEEVTQLTHRAYESKTLAAFMSVLEAHEGLVSQNLGLQRVQDRLFSDFSGVVKSLGAWGGDFVLAASEQSGAMIRSYFEAKGYSTVFGYEEMKFQKIRKSF